MPFFSINIEKNPLYEIIIISTMLFIYVYMIYLFKPGYKQGFGVSGQV